MKYNNNMEFDLIKNGKKYPTLKENQYFVLMVIDENNKNKRSKLDCFDYDLGWVGLECTSGGRIYISKDFNKRANWARGEVMVATVKNIDECYVLKI